MNNSKIHMVNEEDKLIGYGDRGQDSFIYRVSALWLTNSNGQILLAQRSLTDERDPGVWGPAVAGTVEKGETYKSTIQKETREEIGLEGALLNPWYKKYYDGRHRYFTQWYRAVVDWPIAKFRIQEEEVEQIAWLDSDWLRQDLEKTPNKYLASIAECLVKQSMIDTSTEILKSEEI